MEELIKVIVRTPICMNCGENDGIVVDYDAYQLWQNGAYIQDAFPEMTPDEREFLKTGIHPECWTAMFGSGDDE